MNEMEKNHMLHQLRLISAAETLLDQLLSSTREDHQYGRGFGSAFPERALDNLKTMRMCIEMEMKYER
jgi:hypothetical protein